MAAQEDSTTSHSSSRLVLHLVLHLEITSAHPQRVTRHQHSPRNAMAIDERAEATRNIRNAYPAIDPLDDALELAHASVVHSLSGTHLQL
jgi:hypothetical protein